MPENYIEVENAEVEIVKRFYTNLIAHGRLDLTDDLLRADYVDYDLSPDRPGTDGFLSWLEAFARAFRNRVVVLEDVSVAADLVSVRWSASLTHSRAFMGFPPTGQMLEVSGVGVFRIEDGQIAERWVHEDRPGLVSQLTLLTAQADRLRALEEYGSVVLEAAGGAR